MDGEDDCAPFFMPNVNFYCYFTMLTFSQLFNVDDRMNGY